MPLWWRVLRNTLIAIGATITVLYLTLMALRTFIDFEGPDGGW